MASRHALLICGLWVVAAVGATSVGVVAVRLVDNRVGEQVAAPLTSTGVRQALSSVTPSPEPTAKPVPRPTTEPSDEGAARTVTTAGGVVSARCSAGRPRLLYATPADGYRTVRGTSAVRFAGRSRQVTLTLSCDDDDLRVDTRTDRIGTVTSPAPAPTRTSPPPEPSERPEPSDTPEPQESASEGLGDRTAED